MTIDGGRVLVYGTNDGIYVSNRRSKDDNIQPKRVVDAQRVTQIEVLEVDQLLLVISDKSLLRYSLSALNPNKLISTKQDKMIQSNCRFIKVGICQGRLWVCWVKSGSWSTTAKLYQPTDFIVEAKQQDGPSKSFIGETSKPSRKLYIPNEVSAVFFLKSKLCLACTSGFDVVSLETLETQSSSRFCRYFARRLHEKKRFEAYSPR
jgi:hypothetical protein